ncbi:hypothetical protein Bbelb_230750 [Branchiostoma belcheri]|nr:hypothetical protein Bbelb_230750 [Branchiostoma belcheri]
MVFSFFLILIITCIFRYAHRCLHLSLCFESFPPILQPSCDSPPFSIDAEEQQVAMVKAPLWACIPIPRPSESLLEAMESVAEAYEAWQRLWSLYQRHMKPGTVVEAVECSRGLCVCGADSCP